MHAVNGEQRVAWEGGAGFVERALAVIWEGAARGGGEERGPTASLEPLQPTCSAWHVSAQLPC